MFKKHFLLNFYFKFTIKIFKKYSEYIKIIILIEFYLFNIPGKIAKFYSGKKKKISKKNTKEKETKNKKKKTVDMGN